MISFSVLIIGIYDLYPVTNQENRALMGLLFRILLDYAIFAFILNFIREIVKDLEDIEGDRNQGMNTLPISFGISNTVKLVFGLSLISVFLIINYINSYLFSSNLMIGTIYGMVLILAPLIYFTIKIWSAKLTKEFHHLSMVLKWILFFGILSIVVISFNIKYNA
jgi:4-hydroxybenzoate polyprenyltransferase